MKNRFSRFGWAATTAALLAALLGLAAPQPRPRRRPQPRRSARWQTCATARPPFKVGTDASFPPFEFTDANAADLPPEEFFSESNTNPRIRSFLEKVL